MTVVAAPIPYRHELARKLFHMSSIWMAALMYLVPRGHAAAFFTFALLFALSLELLRRKSRRVDALLMLFFGRMLRSKEHKSRKRLTGATYMILAALLTVLIYPPLVASLAFSIMLVGDAVAAIVGRRWGRHPLMGKSVEGTAAFFAAALCCVMVFRSLEPTALSVFPAGIVAALVATTTELVSGPWRIDDNLSISLVTGAVLVLLGAG